MQFLTPLYLAGLAAISLPILFHLIRRTPRNQVTFSSLLFLSPSPPRITRRSRIEHWLLLFLRAAILLLIAAAFARPFLRDQLEAAVAQSTARRIAILVDTSASMRRTDLWQAAQLAANTAVDQLGPEDHAALYAVDDELRAIVPFVTERSGPAVDTRQMIRDALKELKPGWGGSDLGEALVSVADSLHSLDADIGPVEERRLILISDLQEGADLSALRAYDWPEGLKLETVPVVPERSDNVGVELLSVEPQLTQDSRSIRLRVTNADDSARDQYQLQWFREDGTPTGTAEGVYVPAGDSRVVRIGWPEPSMSRGYLELQGDAEPFDNRCYVTRVIPPVRQVVYLGHARPDDPDDLSYFLQRAFQPNEDSAEKWLFEARAPDAGTPLPEAQRSLLITTSRLPDELARSLNQWVEQGGRLCFVCTDPQIESLELIADTSLESIREAPVKDYLMLGEIDFSHPIFEPMSEPRFSDFTPIRFFRYRQIEPRDDAWRVLARFDNTDIALMEKRLGEGSVFVLTTAWTKSDSRLAPSTKFLPILMSMADAHRPPRRLDANHLQVGESLDGVWQVAGAKQASTDDVEVRPLSPSAELAASNHATAAPGLYELSGGRQSLTVGVNLADGESRVTPLPDTAWEQLGVRQTSDSKERQAEERTKQLKQQELEASQSYWRYLLLAAIVLMLLESWLAGRQSRRSLRGETEHGPQASATT